MSVDGAWNITMQTPMGNREASLTLNSNGGKLSGSMSGSDGSADIYDGVVTGDTAAWKTDITQPMPLTLEFSATVAGDSLSGSVQLGSFGEAPFTGERA